MNDKVTFRKDGDVGIVTLDDPPMNLFGREVIDGLLAAVDELLASDCRAAVVLAAGPNFSAGANVTIFRGKTSVDADAEFKKALPLIHKLEAAPFPVIAGVQGLCLAAGLELALGCDIIFAAQGARFSQVEAFIGATTFLGGAQRLAARCGDARAREIVYTADIYDAATFERWNIVNRVLPDEILHQETINFARTLAKGPTRAHDVTKKMLRAFCDGGVRAADAVIFTEAIKLYDTRDMQAGVERILTQGARNVRHGEKDFKGN